MSKITHEHMDRIEAMSPKVRRHLMLRRPSVNRIAEICHEALEHDHTWYEFKDSVERMLKHETRVILSLEDGLGKHMGT